MDYSVIKNENLIKYFWKESFNNPVNLLNTLENLKNINRYKTDLDFKIIIDLYILNIRSSFGVKKEYFELIKNIYLLISKTDTNLIKSLAYLIIGTFFSNIGIFDTALKSYFDILKMYPDRNNEFLSISYYMIGKEFEKANSLTEAFNYYNKALINLRKNLRFIISSYNDLVVSYNSSMAKLQYEDNKFEKAEKYINVSDNNYTEKLNFNTKSIYFHSKIFKYCHDNDIDNLMQTVDNYRNLLLEQNRIIEYVDLFNLLFELTYKNKNGIDIKKYIPEIDSMINEDVIFWSLGNYYKNLIEIYNDNNEIKNNLSYKLMHFVRNEREITNKQYDSILSSIFSIEEQKTKNTFIAEQNSIIENYNLEMENTIKKYEMENKKLEDIVSLGETLTSTLETKDIVMTIISFIEENLDILVETFTVVFYDADKNVLVFDFLYEGGKLLSAPDIPIDRSNSFNAQCFRNREKIIISNFNDSFISKEEKENFIIKNSNARTNSAIFLPITYKTEITGVVSIQSQKPNAFNNDVANYINLFLPYISIALHNSYIRKKLNEEEKITEEVSKKLNKKRLELSKISNIDGLTLIDNRRAYEKKSNIIYDYASKNNIPVHVVMFDIDYFKKYNDTYGHLMGDEVLKIVARTINKYFNDDYSTFARFGGEEFIGIFIEKSNDKAYEKIDNIRNEIQNLQISSVNSSFGIITISIGLYSINNTREIDRNFVIERADNALYLAKNSGRNKVIQLN